MVEKIGVRAVFETDGFKRGLNTYVNGLKDAGKATTAAAGEMDKTGEAAEGAGASGAALGGILGTGVSGGALAAVAAIGATIMIVKKLTDAFMQAIATAKEFVQEGIMLAGRFEELKLVSQLMGQRMGLSADEVTKLDNSLQEAGLRADTARNAITSLSRMKMDPQLALQIAEVAKNSAVLTSDGADTSETLDRLLLGVQRLSPFILRTAGILVEGASGFEAYAQTIDKTAATLTTAEKQQAMFNQVMEQGAGIAGVYDIAMETAGKQFRSLTGREIPMLQAALGEPFLKAWATIIKAVREFVSALTVAFKEGGRLYPILVKLGAIASIVGDAFSRMLKPITAMLNPVKDLEAGFSFLSSGMEQGVGEAGNVVINTVSNIVETLSGAAESAFQWGLNIMISFADGLVKGVSTVLTWAMNIISNALAWFLGPGSAPRVAPDLGKWGISAVDEWLQGFTKGDFSILKGIQKPLKGALDYLKSIGDISEKEAGKTFADISKAMIEALASGGEIDASVIEQIRDATGEFGDAIADLTEKQLDLAAAEEEVAAAENDIADARDREEKAGLKVSKMTQEYNDLLRAGADPATLALKKKEIDAAAAARDEASLQREEAEEDLDIAKDKLDITKSQLDLQKQLVDQLIALAKAQTEAAAAVEPDAPDPAAGAGGGAGEMPALPGGGGMPEFDPDSIGDALGDAIDNAKERILAKWNELLQPLRDKWDEWITTLTALWDRFLVFWGDIKNRLKPVTDWLATAWDDVKEAATIAAEWIEEEWEELLGVLEEWWDEHGESVEFVWEYIKEKAGIVFDWLKEKGGDVIEDIKQFWDRHKGKLGEIWSGIWETIKELFSNALEFIGNYFDFWAAVFKGDFETAWQELKDSFFLIWESIKLVLTTAFDTIVEAAKLWFAVLLDIINWDEIKEKAETALEDMQDKFEEVTEDIDEFIREIFDNLSEWWTETWDDILEKLEETWESIELAVKNAVDTIKLKVESVIGKLETWWSNTWDTIKQKLTDIWEGAGGIVSTIKKGAENIRAKIVEFVTGPDGIVGKWNTAWDTAKTAITDTWGEVTAFATDLSAAITAKFDTFKTKVIDVATTAWDTLKEAVSNMWAKLQETATDISTAISDKLNTFKDNVLDSLKNKFDNVKEKIGLVLDWLNNLKNKVSSGSGIWNAINNFITNMLNPWKDIFDGISSAVDKVIGWINSLITLLGGTGVGAALSALGINIPDELTDPSGWEGPGDRDPDPPDDEEEDGWEGPGDRDLVLASVPITTGSTSTLSTTVNMGGVEIYDQMDIALFEARVLQVIRKSANG